MAIAFVAASAKAAASTTAVTPTLPVGVTADCIVLLTATTIAAGNIGLATTGSVLPWTAITGSPVDVTSGEKVYTWWGRYVSGTTGPTVTASTNHCCAATACWSGGITTGSPVDVQSTATQATATTARSEERRVGKEGR